MSALSNKGCSMVRLRKFISDTAGNFGTMMGLLSIPLILGAGFSVDYYRYISSENHLQELADAAALALAASREQDDTKLRKMARDVIDANRSSGRLETVEIASLNATADSIDIALDGQINATLMGIAGYDKLPSRASALAERAVRGNVEVALVLDNTWSMSETDAKGASKIATLKTAAESLVKELLQTEDGSVRIGLVPYADYVNVGTQYRKETWLSVPEDYTTVPAERKCETKDTKVVCDKQKPKTTCERVVDGVKETYSCGGGCEAGYERTVSVTPYQSCTGGGSGTAYKWYGCIGSRMTSDNRLHDRYPLTPYPGYVETSFKCPTPIVTLTSSKKTLVEAVTGMVINRGGTNYRPNTYIPAGMVWGLNVLSPGVPFADAEAYDSANVRPRKVAVLMTDGENTLRFNSSNGRHVAFDTNATKAKQQFDQTNKDTLALCTYMKAQNIEIYTVAFMVDDAVAKSMLESCATDATHYFDATDSDQLLAAFAGISSALRVVRLAR